MNIYPAIFRRTVLYGILLAAFLLFFLYYFCLQSSGGFRPDTTIQIKSGQSLIHTAKQLQEEDIVTSSFWLTNLVILFGGEHKVVAGYYYFAKPPSLLGVARRITSGDFDIAPIKVTIPEGTNVFEMNEILSAKLNLFDSAKFSALAKDKEGYLFPDTYFFLPNVKPEEAIDLMSRTFDQKIASVQEEINASGRSEKDILTMASILEGEAKTLADRKMVAGILWKRLSIGIALQVDTTFKYINGKSSAELTLNDLKIKSPYNTYQIPGLPPTPISNPGLESITAALEPTPSEYLYFLSDEDGNIHYARTLPEHVANKKKYL